MWRYIFLVFVILVMACPLLALTEKEYFLKHLPESFRQESFIDSLIFNEIKSYDRPQAFLQEAPEKFKTLESLVYLKQHNVPLSFSGWCLSLFKDKISSLEDLVSLHQKIHLGDLVSFYGLENIPQDLEIALSLQRKGILLNAAKKAIGNIYTPEVIENILSAQKAGINLEKTPHLIDFLKNGGDISLAKKLLEENLTFDPFYPTYLKSLDIPNELKNFSFFKELQENKVGIFDAYKAILHLPSLLRTRDVMMLIQEKIKALSESEGYIFNDGSSLYDLFYPRDMLNRKKIKSLSLSSEQKKWVLDYVHTPSLVSSLEKIDLLLQEDSSILKDQLLSKEIYHRAFSCDEEIITSNLLKKFYMKEGKTPKEVCLERIAHVLDKVSQRDPHTGESFNCFVVSGVEKDYNGAFSKPKTGDLLKTEFVNYQGHFCKVFRSFKKLESFSKDFLSDDKKRKILVFGMAHGGPYGDFHGDEQVEFPDTIFKTINNMNNQGHHVALVLDSCYSSFLLKEQIQYDQKVLKKLKTAEDINLFLDKKKRMCLLVSGGLDQKGDLKMSTYRALSTLFEKNYSGRSLLEIFNDLKPMNHKKYRHPLISALPWEFLQNEQELKGTCLEGHEEACKFIYQKNLSYLRASIHYLPDGIETLRQMYFKSKDKACKKGNNSNQIEVLDAFDDLIKKLKNTPLEELPLQELDRARLEGCKAFVIP